MKRGTCPDVRCFRRLLAHHVVLASLRMAASGRSRHEVPGVALRVALHLASAGPLDRARKGASAHSGRHLAGSKTAGPTWRPLLGAPPIRPPLPYHPPYVAAQPKFGRHFRPFTRAAFKRQRATGYYVWFVFVRGCADPNWRVEVSASACGSNDRNPLQCQVTHAK